MVYQRWNIFDVNRVRTKFNNTGLLCDGNQQNFPLAHPPAFEYPNSSGISYGTAVGIVIGAPKDQLPGAISGYPLPGDYDYYVDATLDEGSAAFWNEEHFAPYPEFVGGERALMSDDPESWPEVWPDYYPGTTDPVVIGSKGWPGFGSNGEEIADQESFAVMYGWEGTDSWGQPYQADQVRAWLNIDVICRGLAWQGSLYEDFLVWVYALRNTGTDPIKDMRVGIHSDLGFMPEFLNTPNYDGDRHFFHPELQLAYGWDDNSYEILPDGRELGGEDIAWGGTIALEMPGPSERIATYDAFHFWQYATTAAGNGARPDWYFKWNIANVDDPHDSDGDRIDDDFWTPGDPEDIPQPNGVPDALEGSPGYYIGSGADGLQILSSGPFTLQPGETDTLVFATVFGDNKDDLITNARRALLLYESNWETVDAPEPPIAEGIPGDKKVTLVWGTHSERDVQFEGYKIYRSADGGVTWGDNSFKDFAGSVHYIPLEQFDLENGITGHYRTLPEYAWFDLGSDEWVTLRKVVDVDTLPGIDWSKLEHFSGGDTVNIFTDRDVLNGMRYRYYVAAYDSGNGIVGPLENTPATDPYGVNNTVEVIPHGAVSVEDLKRVRVVPNPHIVADAWEQGKEREVQFIHLPEEATIRIFNVAGELVVTLRHGANGSLSPSIERWDLKSYNGQLVSPGVYFYHVESPIGETTGKFVIVL